MAEPTRHRWLTLSMLLLAAGLTAAVSMVTLTHVIDGVLGASNAGRPAGLAVVWGSLRPADWGLLLLAAASLLALLWSELSGRHLTVFFTAMRPAELWVMTGVATAWFGHAYLDRGLLLGGDVATHINRFLEVANGLRAGVLADWTNYQYTGAPLLWFTGPFTYVVGGAIAFVVGNGNLAAKLILFGTHVLAGLAFLGLVRRLGFAALPAFVATCIFTGSFGRLHMFLYRGVLPQAFTILFLVVLFWAADGLMRQKGKPWVNAVLFALATAGLIVNHQPHALFAAGYLLVFGAVLLSIGTWRARGLGLLVMAGGLGAVASTVAVVPILLEAKAAMIEPEGAMVALRWPAADRIAHLLKWNNTGTVWGFDYWTYLGVGAIGLGAAGVLATAWRQVGRLACSVGAAALAGLAVELFAYNPVVRDMMFMLLFLGLLAAVGLQWLTDRGVLRGRGLLAVTVLVLLDLASTSIQPVTRRDKVQFVEAGRYLARVAPNERFLEVGVGADGTLDADAGPHGTLLEYDAMVQRVGGNHNMAATAIHNFLVGTAKTAETELQRDGVLAEPTRHMLGLLNVTRIICVTRLALGCGTSIKGTTHDPVLGDFVPVAASPAMFAPRLQPLDLPGGTVRPMAWPNVYQADPAHPQFRQVAAEMVRFVAEERPQFPAAAISAIPVDGDPGQAAVFGDTLASVRSYAVGLQTVRLSVEAVGPAWVQVSHPDAPSNRITVNGVAVTALRNTLGMLVLPLPAGSSTIEIRHALTPIRLWSVGASAAGLLGIVGLGVLLRQRARPGTRLAAA